MLYMIRKGKKLGRGDYWHATQNWGSGRHDADVFDTPEEAWKETEGQVDPAKARVVRIVSKEEKADPDHVTFAQASRRKWADAMFFEVMKENERSAHDLGFEARGLYESIQDSWAVRMGRK